MTVIPFRAYKENLFHNTLIITCGGAIDSEYSYWQQRGITKVSDAVKNIRLFRSKLELKTNYSKTISKIQYSKTISSLKEKIINLPPSGSYYKWGIPQS